MYRKDLMSGMQTLVIDIKAMVIQKAKSYPKTCTHYNILHHDSQYPPSYHMYLYMATVTMATSPLT